MLLLLLAACEVPVTVALVVVLLVLVLVVVVLLRSRCRCRCAVPRGTNSARWWSARSSSCGPSPDRVQVLWWTAGLEQLGASTVYTHK